jgi:hypothetical protein
MLGKHQTTQTTFPTLDGEWKVILELEAIIATKENKLHSWVIKEYLIKWKNLLEEDAS